MSTVIRFLNTHTGQPATEADRLAGTAHYVECDHEGIPLRNAAGQCRAYGSPDELSPEVKLATWRGSDPQVQTGHASSADDTAAIRAYLVAKYGDQVAGPEGGSTPHL